MPFPDFEDDDFEDHESEDDDLDIDFDGDEIAAAFAQPLPQADRLWRHPSEIGAAKAAEERARVAAPSPIVIRPRAWRTVAVGVGGGLVGALATVSVLGAIGAFGASPIEPIEVATAPTVVEQSPAIRAPQTIPLAVDVPTVTRKLAPAIVRVEADSTTDTSIGSAIAFRTDGYFLTSAELVADAEQTFVIDSGERTEADVVGVDPYSNIAVLRVNGLSLVPPTIGDTASLVTGSKSVLISVVPSGEVKPTPSEGLITADRRVQLDDNRILSGMIQTNASMNAGVLGGALLDDEGMLVGILSTVVDDESGAGSIGLATPIDVALDIANDYIEYGEASSAWLGIVGSTLREETAESMGIETGGVVINAVRLESPAALAGFRRGDIVTHIDEQPVDSVTTLVKILRRLDPGEFIHVVKIQNDQQVEFIAVVGDAPSDEGGTFR